MRGGPFLRESSVVTQFSRETDRHSRRQAETRPEHAPCIGLKEFNTQINKIRWIIEQTIADFKTWRIMHTDYRRPLKRSPRPSQLSSHYTSTSWPVNKPHWTGMYKSRTRPAGLQTRGVSWPWRLLGSTAGESVALRRESASGRPGPGSGPGEAGTRSSR